MNDLRIPILIASLACVVCAATDLRRFRVPNAVTVSLLVSGLIYQAMTSGWPGLARGFAGAAFGFAALIVPYALGGMGAGDVKLLAGIGAWLGMPMTYDVLIASAIFGGVYALVLAAMAGRLRHAYSDVAALIGRGLHRAEVPVQTVVTQAGHRRRLVPFAAMVALGLFATIARL